MFTNLILVVMILFVTVLIIHAFSYLDIILFACPRNGKEFTYYREEGSIEPNKNVSKYLSQMAESSTLY
jgi:hypothetical protein